MRTRLSFPAVIASVSCLPVIGALISGVLGLSFPIGMIPVIMTALMGAYAGYVFQKKTTNPTSDSVTAFPPCPTPAMSPQPPVADEDPKLRHDIKGIISPAMLAIEALESNSDPAVQKAAQTVNQSFERLLARLKQKTSG